MVDEVEGTAKINNKEDGKEDLKSKKRGKSFYVALGICLLAVLVAIFSTYTGFKYLQKPANKDDFSTNSNRSILPKVTGLSKDDENFKETKKYKEIVNGEKSVLSEEGKNLNLPDSKEEAIPTKGQAVGTIILPAGKKLAKKYSGESPVYSKTFNDWRMHNGVDFNLPLGEKVLAITDGTVKDIYEDPMLGTTVVIDHEGDFTAIYSGLGKTTMVNVGDNIENGAEIGSIGDLPSETLDGEHLHLSVKRGDIYIDPLEVLGKIE